jgi:hypothetical protein
VAKRFGDSLPLDNVEVMDRVRAYLVNGDVRHKLFPTEPPGETIEDAWRAQLERQRLDYVPLPPTFPSRLDLDDSTPAETGECGDESITGYGQSTMYQ